MMKTTFLALALMLALFCSKAQDFMEAPAPKVQRIVEWSRYMKKDQDQSVFKRDEYLFQKDGKLANYKRKGGEWDRSINYYYDKRGRIEKIQESDYEGTYSTKYAYKKRYYVEQWESHDFVLKVFYYVNDKKQVIERKEFQKDLDEEKPEFMLNNRIVYTYTKFDSLQGEAHYQYSYESGNPETSTDWIIYSYFPDTKKRKRVSKLNEDNEVYYFYDYEYDDQGRLSGIMGRSGDGEYDHLTEYLYKDGQTWQKIETSRTEDRAITVYKNGIPIRNRYYERKDYDGFFTNDPKAFRLTMITDLQYVYYD